MPITSIDRYFVGYPNIVGISTTDNISTITADGYWKSQIPIVSQLINGNFQWEMSDLVLMYYATNQVGFFTFDPINLTFIELIVPGDVSSINATAPILANGVSGVPQTGSVTLSLNSSETVTPQQVQESAFNYVTASNVGDAYTVSLSPPIVSLTNGLLVSMTTTHANTTTSPTLKVDALAAKTINSLNNAAPVPGDIAVGFTYLFIYNSAHDAFQLLNPSVSEPNTFSVQANAYNYAVDTGTANAYIANINPPQQAISAGMGVIIQAANRNTGASSLTVNGTAHPILTSAGNALVGGEILANNTYCFIYNSSSTSFILINSSVSISSLPVPISSGGTGVTSVTNSPTANAFAGWDANKNLSANNLLSGYSTTATAAGTTTLTVSSAYNQYFTGSTTQTVVLPVTSTLALGFPFRIINNSTGVVTVNASDSSHVVTMTPNTSAIVKCISTGVTTNAAWDLQYLLNSLAPTQANTNLSLTGAGTLNTPVLAYSYRSLIANNIFYTNLLSVVMQSNTFTGGPSFDTGNIGIIENAFGISWGSTTSISLTNVVAILASLSMNTPSLTTFTAANLVYIAANVTLTNTSLTTFSLPALVTTGGGFLFTASASITTVNLPSLVNMFASFTGTLNALTTLTLTNLNAIGSVGTIPEAFGYTLTANALTTLSMPALTVIGGPFIPVGTLLATVNMPLLTTVGAAFSPTLAALTSLTVTSLATITGAFAPTFATLTTLALPALATCSAGFAPVCALATTVTLTSLATVTGTVAASFAALTTLSMPALLTVTSTFTLTAANLTTFSFNSGLLNIGGNVSITGAALTQASVDGVLVSLANLNGTGGTTAYSSKTVNLSGGTSSTPSSTGLAAKAILVGRGCTVTTN